MYDFKFDVCCTHNKRKILPWKSCNLSGIIEWENKLMVSDTYTCSLVLIHYLVPLLSIPRLPTCYLINMEQLCSLRWVSPAQHLFPGSVDLQLSGQRSSTAVGFLLVQLLISGYLKPCHHVTSEGIGHFGSVPKLASHSQLWKSWADLSM